MAKSQIFSPVDGDSPHPFLMSSSPVCERAGNSVKSRTPRHLKSVFSYSIHEHLMLFMAWNLGNLSKILKSCTKFWKLQTPRHKTRLAKQNKAYNIYSNIYLPECNAVDESNKVMTNFLWGSTFTHFSYYAFTFKCPAKTPHTPPTAPS